jgi:Fur family transcriptional regulator, ferric uptake regulator
MPFLQLFRRYLRDQGLPMTHQREAVASVMFGSSEHMSVEQLEAALRDRGERIGKATVYRTLEMLVRSGLVAEHDFGEGFKRYEHLWGQQPSHGHLVCSECGRLEEFQEPELTRVQEAVAERHGFLPARYRVEVYGLCADCQAAGRTLQWEGLTCPID